MAINLDYDIDLQLEAAATEAEIAATSEPELQHDDGLAGTPEDLSAAALYLREVARNPLLTPQEEIDFAALVPFYDSRTEVVDTYRLELIPGWVL